MSRLIFIIITLLFSIQICGADTPTTRSDSQEYMIIISSYRENVKWSTDLMHKIETELKARFPEMIIRSDYLNSDVAINRGGVDMKYRTIFRSILNESQNTHDATDLSFNTLFKNVLDYPKMIILIGDEAWMYYRAYWLSMGKWIETPVVTAAVKDSTVLKRWTPEEGIDWSTLYGTTIKELVGQYSLDPEEFDIIDVSHVDYKHRVGDSLYIKHKFNVTGVIIPDMVKENVELIRKLKPGVKEIVFVDNDYYNTNYTYRKLEQLKPDYPDLTFSYILPDNRYPDLVFRNMLALDKHKALLTYSWSADPEYSDFSKGYIDSLFSRNQSAPIFSISPQTDGNKYQVGGIHFSLDDCAKKVVNISTRILNGESASDIPFQYVNDRETVLSREALINYKLSKRADKMEDVRYTNIPLPFFKRYEFTILTVSSILVILFGVAFVFYLKHLYNKKQRKETLKYKNLYDELQFIYNHINMAFALYNMRGDSIIKINNNEEPASGEGVDILTNNLFTNPYLSREIKDELRKNHPVNFEISVGKEYFHMIVKPIMRNEYKDARYMAIAMNVTDVILNQKEREKYEKLFSLAAETFKMGIAYYNVRTGVGYANKSWYINLGEEPREEHIIEPTYKYVSPSEKISLLDYIQRVKKGSKEMFQMDLRIQGEDGAVHWIKEYIYHVSLESVDTEPYIVELNLNIDLQKDSELKLNEAKKECDKSIRDTEEFLANISHEIRTPLNAIIGFSEILSNSSEDEDDRNQIVEIIRKNNILLLQLINDILELSKFDASLVAFNFSEIRLNQFMTDVLKESREMIPAGRNLSIACNLPDAEFIFHSDPLYLHHVMKHLINNAIKFTDKGVITLGYFKDGPQYYFFVQDNGRGIPHEKHDVVFKRFEKLDTFVQGSGLGLSLCKSIVNALGGEIGLKSKLSEGSLFWFTLPIYTNLK